MAYVHIWPRHFTRDNRLYTVNNKIVALKLVIISGIDSMLYVTTKSSHFSISNTQ